MKHEHLAQNCVFKKIYGCFSLTLKCTILSNQAILGYKIISVIDVQHRHMDLKQYKQLNSM